MTTTKLVAGAIVLALVAGVTMPALAGGGNSANAPGQNNALLIGVAQAESTGSPTPGGEVTNLGGAISGWFFGNTANAGIDSDAPDRGHGVTPSISPGPQTVGGNFCTLGDAMHADGNC